MNKKLEQELFDKYPKIFIEKDLPMSETCMCWGIDCGNGWFNLLDLLCSSLQWDTDKNDREQVVATQVKEKFGTLRFYTHGTDEYQRGMIALAENMSGKTCDVCGQPGETKGRMWVSTLCEPCRFKLGAK